MKNLIVKNKVVVKYIYFKQVELYQWSSGFLFSIFPSNKTTRVQTFTLEIYFLKFQHIKN